MLCERCPDTFYFCIYRFIFACICILGVFACTASSHRRCMLALLLLPFGVVSSGRKFDLQRIQLSRYV